MPKLQEELEGLQKQADNLGAASEAALQEYQSLKQVTRYSHGTSAAASGCPWPAPLSYSNAASTSERVSRKLHAMRQRVSFA